MTANEPIRTGTLLCWLFGHRFCGYEDVGMTRTWIPLKYCIRCGITKPKDSQ